MANQQLIEAASRLDSNVAKQVADIQREIGRVSTPRSLRVARGVNRVLTWPVRKLFDPDGGYGSIVYVAPKEVRGVGVAVVQQLNIKGEAEIRQTDGMARTVGAYEAPRQYGKHNWFGVKVPWASVMGWVDTRADTPVIPSQVQPELDVVGPVKQTINAAVEHTHPALTIAKWQDPSKALQFAANNSTNVMFNRPELHADISAAENVADAAQRVSSFQARNAHQAFRGVTERISGFNVVGTVSEVELPLVSQQINDTAEARGKEQLELANAAGYRAKRKADAEMIVGILQDPIIGGLAAAVLDKLTR